MVEALFSVARLRASALLVASVVWCACSVDDDGDGPNAGGDAGADTAAETDPERADAAVPDASASDALTPDAGGTPSYAYAVPLATDSPWPKFRRTAAQTGLAAHTPTDDGRDLWIYDTGKGIFSSPVVGGNGWVYVGSADRSFYALDEAGALMWTQPTGEIIDSAALLDDRGRVFVGSGDGVLYAFDALTGDTLWTFEAAAPEGLALINWFEGNVAMLGDGTLLAPNDNFHVYGVDRETGEERFALDMPDQTWSSPAVDPLAQRFYIGNNNLTGLGSNLLAFTSSGSGAWELSDTSNDGTMAASPLIRPNGDLVAATFDGFISGYESATGEELWRVDARDHNYASAALLPDGNVVAPSADGSVYAISEEGELAWTYAWGAPIRSSPAVAADGAIYLGTGDGHLLVLNADGTLRWAIRLVVGDRDDINSSPALGHHAIYIASESGEIFGVPADYCARDATPAGCVLPADRAPADDGGRLRWTTAFGTVLDAAPERVANNAQMAFSLEVFQSGTQELALIDAATVVVEVTPNVDVVAKVAPNQQFLTLRPLDRWSFDEDELTIRLSGEYLVGPDRDGIRFSGGSLGGRFDETYTFGRAADGAPLRLAVPREPGDEAGVWEMSRLAVPLPTLLPSYNQIGFDSLYFIVGLIEENDAGIIAWLLGATPSADGPTTVDPATGSIFPFLVTVEDGHLSASNRDGLALEALSAVLSFETFEVSATLDADGGALGAATVSASTVCGDIELYGFFLRNIGLCNPTTDELVAFGAVLLEPLGDGAHLRPEGVGTSEITYDAGGNFFAARMIGSALSPLRSSLSLAVVDAASGLPVSLDYGTRTVRESDEAGIVTSVRIAAELRDGSPVASGTYRVYLVVDAYPAAVATVIVP